MNGKFHIDNVFFNKPLILGEVKILQLGRLYCKPNESIDKHSHNGFFELTVVTGGEGEIFANQNSSTVSAGEIYLSVDGEIHTIISSEEKPLRYDFFAFEPQTDELKQAFDSLAKKVKDGNRVFKNEIVETLLQNMIAEVLTSDEYSKELLTTSAKQILLLTLRAFSKNLTDNGNITPTKAQILCYQIMNYIDSRITTIKTLTEVADNFLYNYSYLSDLFKTTTGRSIKEYFSSAKLKLAKDKLDTLQLTVTEIAELCNFSSVYSFSRAFKKYYGVSPEQYRKNKT